MEEDQRVWAGEGERYAGRNTNASTTPSSYLAKRDSMYDSTILQIDKNLATN